MDQGSFGLFITDSSMTLPFRCYKPYEDRSKVPDLYAIRSAEAMLSIIFPVADSLMLCRFLKFRQWIPELG